jgi:hypothetical protein
MNFGDALKYYLGECNKETTFEILDHFYSQGGNFIDTANGYQNGESEVWVGEWMVLRNLYCVYDERSEGASLLHTRVGIHRKCNSRRRREGGMGRQIGITYSREVTR